MDDRVRQVGTWLQCTLNPDQAQRVAAEEALKLSQDQPGHVVVLFRLAVDPAIPAEPALRQSAVIYMKNMIHRRWEPRDPPKHLRDKGEQSSPGLSEDDKALVRNNLFQALAVAPPQIRSQLGLCLRTIAFTDYPERWPSLLPSIVAGLSATDISSLYGPLYSLRVLCKTYEFKRDEQRKPLYGIVDATFPMLLQLAQRVLAHPPAADASEIALLVGKIMWSTTQLGLPPWLLQPANLGPWFETMLALLEQPLPEGCPTDGDDAIKWPPFKVKKRIAAIFHRLIQRYGNPSRQIEKDVPLAAETMSFARHFQDHMSARCLSACVTLLGRRHAGLVLPNRITTSCLQYIEEAIKYKLTYALLKPQLGALFSEMMLPLLSFSEKDSELWEEDPHEYVRKEFDMIEDFYSPRTAATNLLTALTKKRGKDCLHGIVATCSETLARAQGTADPALARLKDGALLAIGTLHKDLAKRDMYRPALEPMLKLHVLPELTSAHGFLRARAIWTYGQFARSIFREGRATEPEHLALAFQRFMECMQDPALPVRVNASIAIEAFVQGEVVPQAVVQVLPQLLELLFSLLKEVGSDEIVATLDTLIEKHGEQMVPYAVQVVAALCTSFTRIMDESESGDDDDDCTMAAMGIMQALTTMMEAVAGTPEVYAALEAPLLPLLVRCCREGGEDFFEEAMEILAYLTFHQRTLSEGLFSMIPILHEAFHTWARDYINQILAPLDNYIHKATDVFLTANGGAYVQMTMSICRGVLVGEEAEAMGDCDVFAGPKLIESLMHNCRGRIDALMPELVGMIHVRLHLDDSDGQPGLGLTTLLYTALGSAIHYNPLLTLQILEHRQCQAALLTSWVKHLGTICERPCVRAHDLKIALLAVSSMLAMPTATAPYVIASNRLMLVRQALTLQARLVKAYADQERQDDDEEEDDDDDDGADFDGEELGDDVDGDNEDDTATLRRLLNSDRKFNLDDFLKAGGHDDDDELDDEEEYTSPIDDLDELIEFSSALEAACREDPNLLAAVGLGATAEGMQISAEENAALRSYLQEAVQKKHEKEAARAEAAAGGGLAAAAAALR